MSTLRIPPEYSSASADKLPQAVREAVERMAKKEPNDAGELFIALVGPVGTGKTWMAWSVADYFAKTQEFGKFPLFYTESELLDRLRHAASTKKADTYTDTFVVATKKTQELLVIDDFGATKQTDFSIELLTDLLEYRISWHLPTMITSNLRLDQLEAVQQAVDVYGERIVSRIAGRFHTFILDGKDRRKG